jgi:hypothetical protein
MKRIAWFDPQEVSPGLVAPFVWVTLGIQGKTSNPIQFLVDSGASRSILPRYYVASLLSQGKALTEADSALQDAAGRPVKGLEVDFDVSIVGTRLLPVARERVLVGRDIKWAVLGMTWFEKVGVHFQNFPRRPYGRKFALYACPFEAM